MKYFSLFQSATCVKNRLDRAVVDMLQHEMSNLLVDGHQVGEFEQKIRDATFELCKVFPQCTPIEFVCFDDGDLNDTRRYSLAHGPNLTFCLYRVRGDHSAEATSGGAR